MPTVTAALNVSGVATASFVDTNAILAGGIVSAGLAVAAFASNGSADLITTGAATATFGGGTITASGAIIATGVSAVSFGGKSSVSAAATIASAASATFVAIGYGSGTPVTANQTLDNLLYQDAKAEVMPRVWDRIRRVGTNVPDLRQDITTLGADMNDPTKRRLRTPQIYQ